VAGYDQDVIDRIIRAARANGADPTTMLASGIVESGLTHTSIGDNGTSFGAMQWHRGGALGTHDAAWTRTDDAFNERARAFAASIAKYGATGQAAADAQRPFDPGGYAAKVKAAMKTAREILSGITPGEVAPATPAPGDAPAAPAAPSGSSARDALQFKLDARQQTVQSSIDSNAKLAGIPSSHAPRIVVPATFAPDLPSGELPAFHVEPDAGVIAPEASTIGAAAVAGAKQFLGLAYKWGGTSPKTGFDCSGLMQYVFKGLGVNIPRVSQDQFKSGQKVPAGQLRAGDLVFFAKSGDVHHVGMYVGNGQFIQSPRTGDVVKISTLADRNDFVGARRYA